MPPETHPLRLHGLTRTSICSRSVHISGDAAFPMSGEAPTPETGLGSGRQSFKRTYKACQACRRTKARCERAENSHSCFKCLREGKECLFPAQRSTKRAKTVRPAVHQGDASALREESLSRADDLQDHVVQTVVASSSDAVGLLFRAAECSDSEGNDSAGNRDVRVLQAPSVCTSILSPGLNTSEPVAAEIVELWNQHRFVRQGWFTAREAIAYLQA